jgi:two-component system LytT family response regulator
MKYKTIIIDDEDKLREVIKIKINHNCPELEIVGLASNAKEAYEMIKDRNPDLIFLDIAMPNESGFDLISKFDKIDFEIIFATGYNEYALDALKVSAVDYLLKPIKTSDLVQAVINAKERINTKEKLKDYDLLKHNIQNIGDQKSRIAIPGSEAYQFVEVEDIIRCEGWQKYTKIHLIDGACIISSYNIGIYKDMLNAYGFFCCHKSHLINSVHVTSYNRDGFVVMSDESTVPVSRRKKDEFLSVFVKRK